MSLLRPARVRISVAPCALSRYFAAAALTAASWSCAPVPPARAQTTHTLHFASNGNLDARNAYLPGPAGFNLADVSGAPELDRLPNGVKGLVWIGKCNGADAEFRGIIQQVATHPKLFGFYLMDDPDPTGRWRRKCPPANLLAESDWIHSQRPDALTFIGLMNLAPSSAPSFGGAYTPETTHVDLFGVAPYPCRTELPQCDYAMIGRFVDAVLASGIPLSKIVPTYQTFGHGGWHTDSGGQYRLPTGEEMLLMLQQWGMRVPTPVFDYAYSWGTQKSDLALETSAELQAVFAAHNSSARAVSSPAPAP